MMGGAAQRTFEGRDAGGCVGNGFAKVVDGGTNCKDTDSPPTCAHSSPISNAGPSKFCPFQQNPGCCITITSLMQPDLGPRGTASPIPRIPRAPSPLSPIHPNSPIQRRFGSEEARHSRHAGGKPDPLWAATLQPSCPPIRPSTS